MKQCSQALKDLLATSRQLYKADLYTLTLLSGTVLRYTNRDADLTVGGNLYKAFGIKRDRLRQGVGLEVDDLDLEITAGPDDTLPGGESIIRAMRSGAFDNCQARLDVVFSPTPWRYIMLPISSDYVLEKLFVGRLQVDKAGGLRAEVRIKAPTEKLDIQIPRNLYSPGCQWTLYDSGCQVARENYTAIGQMLAGSTTTALITSLAQGDGYYDAGVITITSGLNDGIRRSVRSYAGGVIRPVIPLPHAPAVGDTFSVYPTCSRTMSVCQNKFNNLLNFRGQPFIPVPETLY